MPKHIKVEQQTALEEAMEESMEALKPLLDMSDELTARFNKEYDECENRAKHIEAELDFIPVDGWFVTHWAERPRAIGGGLTNNNE